MGLFSAFQKPLLYTTVEVLCQNNGHTMLLKSNRAEKRFTCRSCAKETFIVRIGKGTDNVTVHYIGADNTVRELTMIHRNRGQEGFAQYYADRGTFILVDQEQV